MNVESLKFSKSYNSEVSTSKETTSTKKFADALTKANSTVSQKDQNEKNNQGTTNKVSQEDSTVDQKAEKKQEVDTTNSKDTSSNVKYDLSKGLEGLLNSVSKSSEKPNEEKQNSANDLKAILKASSLEELGNILNLNLNQKDFSNGLSLDKVLKALGINKEELLKTIQQLTGKQSKAEDVWNMLAGINQNSSVVVQNLLSSIKGDADSKISKSQASQLLQFLKVVQLVAPKTDLTLKQEYQSYQVKDLLTTLSLKAEQAQTQTQTSMGYSQLVKSASKIQPLNIKLVDPSASDGLSTVQTSTMTANTSFTITLPTNKANQAEAFVKEFQAIMNRSQFSNNAAGTRLLIKLYPENLGSIRVELAQKDGVLTARLLASSSIGKEMLESQLQQLKQGLANQNIQLDRIEVAQALNETNRHEKGQQQFQQAFKQHTDDQQKQKKDDQEEESNFNDFLMELGV